MRDLLYPIGFLSSLCFGGRFLYQWLDSEIKRRSTVTSLFWVLSLVGNILLYTHSVIQLQIHVALIQATNAVISWRNLDLIESKKPARSSTVVVLLGATVAATVALFFWQAKMWPGEASNWVRTPTFAYLSFTATKASTFWHVFGTAGLILFSCRFWVQWWYSEKHSESHLNLAFWWSSLVGSLMTLVYFARIQDPANLIGPIFGLIPYIRNLMLIKKAQVQ